MVDSLDFLFLTVMQGSYPRSVKLNFWGWNPDMVFLSKFRGRSQCSQPGHRTAGLGELQRLSSASTTGACCCHLRAPGQLSVLSYASCQPTLPSAWLSRATASTGSAEMFSVINRNPQPKECDRGGQNLLLKGIIMAPKKTADRLRSPLLFLSEPCTASSFASSYPALTCLVQCSSVLGR